MLTGSLQVCIVVDAGRSSPTRIGYIADGWARAFRKAAKGARFRLKVGGSLVSGEELMSGMHLFANLPRDGASSALEIERTGTRLCYEINHGLVSAGEASLFRRSLVRMVAESERSRPSSQRRLLVVYRQSFNAARGTECRKILADMATVHATGTFVLLVGQHAKDTGTPQANAQAWMLAAEGLRSFVSVEEHALEILKQYTSEACEPAGFEDDGGRIGDSAAEVLMCDYCASIPAGCEEGKLCKVCGMGVIQRVWNKVSSPVVDPVEGVTFTIDLPPGSRPPGRPPHPSKPPTSSPPEKSPERRRATEGNPGNIIWFVWLIIVIAIIIGIIQLP